MYLGGNNWRFNEGWYLLVYDLKSNQLKHENLSMNVTLTEEQKLALYRLVKGVREDFCLEQTMGGYAGTGKTTVIKYLIQFFPNFAVAAYTGKAANVLRKKGMFATTIHSRIYKPYFDNGVVYFDLTDEPGCEGFIIDEASMVSSDIYDDLKSFGKPMIFIGDHGQLEPIDSRLNLMEKPDYTLETIHRNAGDIARFAEFLRMGYASRGFKTADNSVEFVKNLTDKQLASYDQIICAFNKSRVELNTKVRSALGHKGVLNVGERIMCLRNSRREGLFNGMQGVVKKIYMSRGKNVLDFEFDGLVYESISYDVNQFGQESYKQKQGGPHPFDYAYAITAHKAQGDEWGKVLVIEQKCKNWSHKRWAYTAASRAKEKLVWQPAR